MLTTQLIKKHLSNRARVTKVTTHHGEFITPAFMPVGTRAVVNCMSPTDLRVAGSEIILGGNTYHMLCAPGMDVIKQAGGMHEFMQWSGPMLTDSGGYQVFSLSKNQKLCRIDEKGAHFKHPKTGKLLHLTPETSLAAQKVIGADIIMAFDQCTEDSLQRDKVIAAMQRTHRWLKQCVAYQQQHPMSAYDYPQALFGIIQGAFFEDLRKESAEFVISQAVDGIAIGGETIGYDMEKTVTVLDWLAPLLPENKTRYTMGLGAKPQDLIDAVAQGADIFDCVAPTRNARHGHLYNGVFEYVNDWLRFDSEHVLIKKSIYANDHNPIMEDCDCTTCQNYTRAYLHHLYKQGSPAYYNLACNHNIRVMHKTCELMKDIITAEK